MHVSLHLYCVNRGSGTGAGHITCALPEKITFLDGNVYYMDSEGKKLYKVPADNISAQPELVYEIKSNRFCQEIASEQDYVYGKCIYEDDKSCGFFQYNVKTDTNKWYHFDKEGWPGVFGELNICDSYIYIDYYTDYSGEGSPTKLVYRFKANHDKEGGTFKPERLYSFESTQKADVALVILQNEQKIAVHVNDDKESLILLNLDGSGEPYVLNDE